VDIKPKAAMTKQERRKGFINMAGSRKSFN